MRFACILIALALTHVPLIAAYEEEQKDHEKMPVHFVLKTIAGEKLFKFDSAHITKGKSAVLFRAIEAAADDKTQRLDGILSVPLEIDDAAAFQQILHFMETGVVELNSILLLPNLIFYAHYFDIPALGALLSSRYAQNNFAILDQIKDSGCFIDIAKRIAAINRNINRSAEKNWEPDILDAFLKYIWGKEVSNDPRHLKAELASAFRGDEDFLKRLRPDVDSIDEVLGLLSEQRRAAKGQEEDPVRDDARRWAQEVKDKIGEIYLELAKKGRAGQDIEILIDAKQARFKREALAQELPTHEVELSPNFEEYILPWEIPSGSRFLSDVSLFEVSDFSIDFAHYSAVFFQFFAGQCLQMATCGYCFCCGTDFKSGKDALTLMGEAMCDSRSGRFVFHLIYESCSFCWHCRLGQKRTIRLIRKGAPGQHVMQD